MAFTVERLLEEVYVQLKDERMRVRWPVDELVDYLNDGALLTVALRPEAGATSHIFSLVAGTRQTVPADGIRLLDLQYGVVGGLPADAVRHVDRNNLDGGDPGWHGQAGSLSIYEYAYDHKREPMVFWVNPPALAGAQVAGTYSKKPDIIDATAIDLDTPTATTLPLSTEYFVPLMHYILWRAYDKEDEYASNEVRAVKHGKQYFMLLGEKAKADALGAPAINEDDS